MDVGRFCIQEVVTAHRDTGIRDAAARMRKDHIGALVVTEREGEGSVPVGIVTDRDLVVEVLAQDVDLDALTLGDLLQDSLETIDAREDLWEAIERMSEIGVRRLPVIDSQGYLRGILSVDDVLEWFAESMDKLRSLMAREVWHEAGRRR